MILQCAPLYYENWMEMATHRSPNCPQMGVTYSYYWLTWIHTNVLETKGSIGHCQRSLPILWATQSCMRLGSKSEETCIHQRLYLQQHLTLSWGPEIGRALSQSTQKEFLSVAKSISGKNVALLNCCYLGQMNFMKINILQTLRYNFWLHRVCKTSLRLWFLSPVI